MEFQWNICIGIAIWVLLSETRIFIWIVIWYDCYGYLVVKSLQWGRAGFSPWFGKIPWRREWQPTPVFLSGEFHGQRSLAGYSPWGYRELDMTEWLTHTDTWSLTCSKLNSFPHTKSSSSCCPMQRLTTHLSWKTWSKVISFVFLSFPFHIQWKCRWFC